MKHWLLTLGVALLALGLPLSVSAATTDDVSADYVAMMDSFGISATPPGEGADVAVGNAAGIGTTANGVTIIQREIQLAATSNLASGTAEGTLWENLNPNDPTLGTFRAHVICVSANGNVATVGAIIDQSHSVLPVGDFVAVTVYDNDPAPYAFSLTDFEVAPLPVVDGQCAFGPFPPDFVVQDGDIKVKDGQG